MSTSNTELEPVLLEESIEGVRVLRLNRPKKKNALSNELTREITRAVEDAAPVRPDAGRRQHLL